MHSMLACLSGTDTLTSVSGTKPEEISRTHKAYLTGFFVQDIVQEGLISSAQLEAVLYANMCFKVFLEGPGDTITPLSGSRCIPHMAA